MAGTRLQQNRFKADIHIPVTLFVVIMFLVYPLYYDNYYFNIVTCKFIVFVIMNVLLMMAVGIYFFSTKIYKHGYSHCSSKKEKCSIEDGYNKCIVLSRADMAAIFLWGINVISQFVSENKLTALVGADGRNAGLITVTCYLLMYFSISRMFTLREWHIKLLAISSSMVGIIGCMNFLYIDFLGFYKGLSIGQKAFYISTLGHVDVYSSFFAITFPILLTMCISQKKNYNKLFYCITAVINGAGLLAGQCESAYIILGTSLFLAFICSRNKADVRILLFNLMTIILIIKTLTLINQVIDNNRELEKITALLVSNEIFIPLCMMLLTGVVISHIINIKNEKGFKKVIIIIVISAFIVYVILVVIFTTIAKEVNLGAASNYLRLTDEAGSYRGYIWKLLIKDYLGLDIVHKIFGIGCDALRPYVVSNYGMKMYKVTNAYYDNAHNEYLQYLITTGFAGLGMYLYLLFLKIKNTDRKNVFKRAALCGVICYLVQAAVNINQVVTTPFLVIMVSML